MGLDRPMSGCDELLGDLVAKARQGARGETDARELGEREKQMRLTKRSKVVAVAAIVGLIGSGAAYAYWTTTGSGTGSAETGSNNPITVVQTASSVVLQPGGASSTLSGTFENPNTSPVYVHDVTATLDSVTNGGLAPDECTTNDYALTTATITINAEVLADDSSTWTGIQVSMLDSSTNQDKCKDATINVTYATS